MWQRHAYRMWQRHNYKCGRDTFLNVSLPHFFQTIVSNASPEISGSEGGALTAPASGPPPMPAKPSLKLSLQKEQPAKLPQPAGQQEVPTGGSSYAGVTAVAPDEDNSFTVVTTRRRQRRRARSPLNRYTTRTTRRSLSRSTPTPRPSHPYR